MKLGDAAETTRTFSADDVRRYAGLADQALGDAVPEPLIAGSADQAATLADSLQQAFASLLPAVHPSIEVAAEMAELGPRTLRRRLAQEGPSWRAVVDRARVEACLRLLRDPERPLSQVAAALGYSDQAHLTRAFRRWMGECPSAYRRRLHR